MQNKLKCCYCIRENSHPMIMELNMLTKDALQEAGRSRDLEYRFSKGFASKHYWFGNFRCFEKLSI